MPPTCWRARMHPMSMHIAPLPMHSSFIHPTPLKHRSHHSASTATRQLGSCAGVAWAWNTWEQFCLMCAPQSIRQVHTASHGCAPSLTQLLDVPAAPCAHHCEWLQACSSGIMGHMLVYYGNTAPVTLLTYSPRPPRTLFSHPDLHTTHTVHKARIEYTQ